jgi:hypothetical protein
MTEEEYRRMAAAVQRNLAAKSPGMINQSATDARAKALADATRSAEGMAARAGAQQAMANELRRSAMPEGRTAGNIFAASNPLETLAAVADRGMGAYMQNRLGRAGGGYDQLDEAKSAQLQGAERLADIRVEEGRGHETGLQKARLMSNEQIADAQRRNAIAVARMNNQAKSDLAQEGRNYGWKTETFHDPKDQTKALNLAFDGRTHRLGSPQGPEVSADFVQSLTPWDTTATGSSATITKALMEKEDEAAGGVANLQQRAGAPASILLNPLLPDAAGYNPQALLGRFGQGPKGAEIQDLQRQIASEQLGGLIPALAAADLTPVSDTDVKKLERKYTDAFTQPYGLVGFYAKEARPTFEQKYDEAIAAGKYTEADKAEYIKGLDTTLIRAAKLHGYPDHELIAAGVDPEYIRYVRMMDEEQP